MFDVRLNMKVGDKFMILYLPDRESFVNPQNEDMFTNRRPDNYPFIAEIIDIGRDFARLAISRRTSVSFNLEALCKDDAFDPITI